MKNMALSHKSYTRTMKQPSLLPKSKSTGYITQDLCYQVSKTILINKLYAHLFTAVQQMINNMSNSIHPTLPPSIIFKGTKIDLNFQKNISFGSYTALHYAKRVDNKYQSHTDNLWEYGPKALSRKS